MIQFLKTFFKELLNTETIWEDSSCLKYKLKKKKKDCEKYLKYKIYKIK